MKEKINIVYFKKGGHEWVRMDEVERIKIRVRQQTSKAIFDDLKEWLKEVDWNLVNPYIVDKFIEELKKKYLNDVVAKQSTSEL